jgi:GT2 family glycosyltransferase
MDLSVIILSYNTRDLLEQSLRTVAEAASGINAELFVVDNASRDGSADMVAEKFPGVRLIRNEKNLGFAAGNNVALRLVTGRYVLLLNSDTIVRQDTLSCLMSFLEVHPEAGAAGCKILNPDGSLQLSCRRGFPTPTAALAKLFGLSRLFPNSARFARYNLTYLDPDDINEVDALSGSCMMVRKEAVDQAGMLDEDYFFFGEDLDWCFCIRQAGWKIFYVPETEIIHFKGESSRAEEMRVLYRFYQAMSIFATKHMRRRYRFFPMWLLHVGIVVYGLFSFSVRVGRRLALPLIDGALVLAGIKLGLVLRYHPSTTPVIHAIERAATQFGFAANPTRWLTPPAYTDLQWFFVYSVSTAVWLAAFQLLGLYDRRRLSAAWAALAVAFGFAGIVTTVFFFKAYNFSRLAAGTAWFFNTILIAGWRLVAARLAHGGGSFSRQRILVVGPEKPARDFLELLARTGSRDYDVVGVVGEVPESRGRAVAGKPTIGLVPDLQQLVREYDIAGLVFLPGATPSLQEMGKRWGRKRLRIYMIAGEILVDDAQTPAELPLIEILPKR